MPETEQDRCERELEENREEARELEEDDKYKGTDRK